MELNQLSSKIIGAAINVHKEVGPGLLESVYHACLLIELRAAGLQVESEVSLPIVYRGQQITKNGFSMDLVVEDTIVVELKSAEQVLPVHEKQLLTYLRLAKKPLGLLINFNVPLLKEGIHRVINSSESST